MKKLIFWALLFALSAQLQAQDKKAKILLNQVSSKVKAYKPSKLSLNIVCKTPRKM